MTKRWERRTGGLFQDVTTEAKSKAENKPASERPRTQTVLGREATLVQEQKHRNKKEKKKKKKKTIL